MQCVESFQAVKPDQNRKPWVVTIALFLGVGLLLLVVARYLALSSNVADLGFFSTNLVNVSVEWPRAFYGHAQPLMLLWGAAYQALPADIAPVILVGFQAVLLLGSVAAIWWKFGVWPGVAILLYYPLWANALFDFHFDHIVVPLLAVFFIACEMRQFGWATLAAASLVLVKEPFALQTMACGAYFLWLAPRLRGEGYSTRLLMLGLGLIFLGGAAFYALTQWLIPYFSGETDRFALASGAFSWLGGGLAEIIWTLIAKPDFVLAEVIGTPGKLVYLAVVFGLLACVPLLRPAALIVALPLLMIAMLSRVENYYGYANQYTAGVIVPAIVAFRDGLPIARRYFDAIWAWVQRASSGYVKLSDSRVNRNDKGGQLYGTGNTGYDRSYLKRLFARKELVFSGLLVAWLVAGHWALSSSPISRLFWSDKVWSYSWRAYAPTERTAMMKQAMLHYIPTNPKVSVSTQNTVNWYHLSHRKAFMPFPMGIVEPYKVMDWSGRSWKGLLEFIRTGYKPPATSHGRFADYVVLDLKRPYFLVDRGCEWVYGVCRDKAMEKKFLNWVAYTHMHYQTVFEQDGFMILKSRNGR